MKHLLVLALAFTVSVIGCVKESDQQGSAPGGPAYSGTAVPAGFTSITPGEATKLIGTRKDLYIVDVRSPQELREGSIEGSVLVPFLDVLQGKTGLPKDRPILLVCAIGGRSYTLGKILVQNGWPEIYNLSGGIAQWKREGYPLKY